MTELRAIFQRESQNS